VSKLIRLNDHMLVRLSKNRQIQARFPIFKTLRGIVDGDHLCCRKRRRSKDATEFRQPVAAVKSAIAGLTKPDLQAFKKLINADQLVVFVRERGATVKKVL